MSPYNYEEFSFDLNYRKAEDELVESCIHEMIHFYWFMKWSLTFEDDDIKNREWEHMRWLFSEIAIDAIMNETALCRYVVKERPSYRYFYDIIIGDKSMMDYFRELFRQNNIVGFMKKGDGICCGEQIVHLRLNFPILPVNLPGVSSASLILF